MKSAPSRDTTSKLGGNEKIGIFLRWSAKFESQANEWIHPVCTYITRREDGLKNRFGSIGSSSGVYKNSPSPISHAEAGVQQLQCTIILDVVQDLLIRVLFAPEASTPKSRALV